MSTATASHHQKPNSSAPGHALLDIEIHSKGRPPKLGYITDDHISQELVTAVGETLSKLITENDEPQRLLISLINIAGITRAELAFAEGVAADNGTGIDRHLKLINALMEANMPHSEINLAGKN